MLNAGVSTSSTSALREALANALQAGLHGARPPAAGARPPVGHPAAAYDLADFLAHAQRFAGLEVVVPLACAGRHQQDDGRPHVEPAEQVAFRDPRSMTRQVERVDDAALRGRISPVQGVEMLPTLSAPTKISTSVPESGTKCMTRRSLRRNSPRKRDTVASLTLNRSPGT